MATTDEKSIDLATIEMLDKAVMDGVATAFERAAAHAFLSHRRQGQLLQTVLNGPLPAAVAQTPLRNHRGKGFASGRLRLVERSKEIGIPNFFEMIADETIGVTEEEILPFLEEKGHPDLTMDPLL